MDLNARTMLHLAISVARRIVGQKHDFLIQAATGADMQLSGKLRSISALATIAAIGSTSIRHRRALTRRCQRCAIVVRALRLAVSCAINFPYSQMQRRSTGTWVPHWVDGPKSPNRSAKLRSPTKSTG